MDIVKLDQIQNVYAAMVSARNHKKDIVTDPDLDAAMALVLQCEVLRALMVLNGQMSVLIESLSAPMKSKIVI